MKNIYILLAAILFTTNIFAGKPNINGNVSATGFIQNKGQIIDQNNNPNSAVKYLYSGNGLNVQLRSNGFSYDTYTIERKPKQKNIPASLAPSPLEKAGDEAEATYHFHRIDVDLIGANPNPTIINADASEAYYNYFTTGTPEGGVSNVHSFQEVTYKNIYPNIDLQFVCDAKKGFKYNFIVHPGGDYTQIKLQYNGANETKLQNGKILISTANGNVSENIPLSYLQENNLEVNVTYKVTNKNQFSFSINGNYNTSKTLVIDPTPNLAWGTYYGGTGSDYAEDITIDASNNLYITGETSSTANIATVGAYKTIYSGGTVDAYVAKFNPSGATLIWGTYYGGSANDLSAGIVLDPSNNVYIAGQTQSSNGISTAGAYQTSYAGNTDAFIAKFNSTGTSLLFGTYFGSNGSATFGQDQAGAIKLDASNNIYITGTTTSSVGIATGGAWLTTYLGAGGSVGYVAKFNSSGSSLLFGTYYSNNAAPIDIALDASSNIYIAGYTGATTSIATAGAYQTTLGGANDAFVAKFNNALSTLIWGTYYGGSGTDVAYALAIDNANNAYVTGWSVSSSGIATAGAYQTTLLGGQDIFVGKINSTGTSLLWGTYYGGSGANEQGNAIAVDGIGNVYITGQTNSTNGISTAGAYQTVFSGTYDAFLSKISPTGNSLLWGSYYGGTGNENPTGIALDASGNIYLSGWSASTSSIATVGAYQTTNATNTDAFIAKFAPCSVGPNQPGAISGLTTMCTNNGATTYSIATVAGATSYTWSLPGGWSGTSATNTISATPGSTGIFTVTASNACGTSPQQTLNVTVNTLPVISVNSGSICSGNSFTIIPGGANTYTIQGGSAVVSPTTTSSYTVTGTSTAGCVSASSATSNVAVNPSPTISVNSGSICSGNSFTIIPSGANTYTIQGGSAVVSPTTTSSYTVTGTSTAGCVSASSATSNVTVNALPTISASTTNTLICVGQSATLTASGASTYTFNPGGAGTNITVSPTVTSTYTITGTSAQGCNNTSTFTQSVSTCAGIVTLSGVEGQLSVYPNPVNETLNIDLPNFNDSVDIKIVSALGQTVLDDKLTTQHSAFNIQHFPSGIYFIRIGSVTKKLIKQ